MGISFMSQGDRSNACATKIGRGESELSGPIPGDIDLRRARCHTLTTIRGQQAIPSGGRYKAMGEQMSQNDIWKEVLEKETSPLHKHLRLYAMLPSSPRCKLCYAPFGGVGGLIMRMAGRERSRMNPNMCGVCERLAKEHPGGAEVQLSLLFADIRGSTALAE